MKRLLAVVVLIVATTNSLLAQETIPGVAPDDPKIPFLREQIQKSIESGAVRPADEVVPVEGAPVTPEEEDQCPAWLGFGQRAIPKSMDRKGYSLEQLCVLSGTALGRDRWLAPKPSDDVDLLLRYTRVGPYEHLSDEDYRKIMKEAVQKWPTSKYALEGYINSLTRGEPFSNLTPGDAAEAVQAAEKLKKIAEKEGLQVPYATIVAELFVYKRNKEGAVEFFRDGEKKLQKRARKLVLYPLMGVLERLGDVSAAEFIYHDLIENETNDEQRREFQGNYVDFLIRNGQAQRALGLLALDGDLHIQAQKKGKVGTAIFFRRRCIAHTKLKDGQTTDCEEAERIEKNMFPYNDSQSNVGKRLTKSEPEKEFSFWRLFAPTEASAQLFVHPQTEDYCRTSGGPLTFPIQGDPVTCETHPLTGPSFCWGNWIWNFAELIQQEGNLENFGERVQIAWSVRNRVIYGESPGCGDLVGSASAQCSTTEGSDFCKLQKDYCRVIHKSGQYSVPHMEPVFPQDLRFEMKPENLYIAAAVAIGRAIEPLTGYATPNTLNPGDPRIQCPAVPYTGTAGSTNICTEPGLACGDIRDLSIIDSSPAGATILRDLFGAAIDNAGLIQNNEFDIGPTYFLANCATAGCVSTPCQGLHESIGIVPVSDSCVINQGEACGNNFDGEAGKADHCYSRFTRKREFLAGRHFYLSDPAGGFVTGDSNNALQVNMSNSAVIQQHLRGGGKRVRVEAKLATSGPPATLWVFLAVPGVFAYGFPTALPVNSTSYKNFDFISETPVYGAGIPGNVAVYVAVLPNGGVPNRHVVIRTVKILD